MIFIFSLNYDERILYLQHFTFQVNERHKPLADLNFLKGNLNRVGYKKEKKWGAQTPHE
jgi:hypothetical protein